MKNKLKEYPLANCLLIQKFQSLGIEARRKTCVQKDVYTRL